MSSSPSEIHEFATVTFTAWSGSIPSVLFVKVGVSILTPHAVNPLIVPIDLTWNMDAFCSVILYKVRLVTPLSGWIMLSGTC